MANIIWPDKTTGDSVSATDMNEVKSAVNSKQDNLPSPTGQDGKVLAVSSGAYALVTPSGDSTTYGWLNAEEHGIATGNTASVNTTAINALMSTAITQKKGIQFGGGTFLFNTILWNGVTPIKGVGWRNTELKSASAVPLIQWHTYAMDLPSTTISDIALNGNDIGTVGLDVEGLAYYKLANVYFTHFTSIGWKGGGNILGEAEHCYFIFNPIGASLFRTPQDFAPSGMPPNFVKFRDCYFQDISTIGLKVDGSGGIIVDGCDFERVGTVSNTSTGAIHISNVGWERAYGLQLSNAWIERCEGHVIKITNPSANTRNTITGSSIIFNETAVAAVYLQGTSGNSNTLEITSSAIYASGALITDGANAKTYQNLGDIQTHTETNSGQYYTADYTLYGSGGGADVTPPTVTGATATTANNIRISFSEAMGTPSSTGWSFNNGGVLTISGVTAVNSSTWDFTITETMAAGQTITRSYNSSTGSTVDQASTPNELVSFTSQAVTNSISSGGGTGLPHTSSFTAADGTDIVDYVPDEGTGWSVFNSGPSGSGSGSTLMEVQGNKMTGAFGGLDDNLKATTDVGATDYTITTVLTRTLADRGVEVIFRFTDADNHITMFTANGHAGIYNVVGGVTAQIGVDFDAPDDNAGDNTYVLSVIGTTLNLSINGNPVQTDVTIPSSNMGTRVGFALKNEFTCDYYNIE